MYVKVETTKNEKKNNDFKNASFNRFVKAAKTQTLQIDLEKSS